MSITCKKCIYYSGDKDAAAGMILCAASSKTIIEIRVFKSLTILMKCDLRLAGEHARRLAERERVTKIRRDDPQAITDQASLLTSE